MPPTRPRRPTAEVARLGSETFDTVVQPQLLPGDNGKFVAVDIVTGDYEVDADDYTAISRLRKRNPMAEIWLEMAGQPTAYKIRRAL